MIANYRSVNIIPELSSGGGGGLGRGRRREGMEGQGKEDEREEVYEIIRIRAFTIIRDY